MGTEDFKNLTYLSDTYIGERKLYEDTVSGLPAGVLRVVEGPLAEWNKLNRNNRMYSEKLWDNVLASSYVKEQLSYQTLYGEAGHPQDRFEIDFGRVSHSIVALWKVPESDQIHGRIYILDTPMGRILNTLYDAGGTIGYSSRAGGVLHQKKDYIDVDEKTYNFITFDAVPYPSVVIARPGVVSEGVEGLVSLPEEVHSKLCAIINESGRESRNVLKDFIYSIQGYDLTQEKQIFEGKSPVKLVNESPKKEESNTKMLDLIKENSLQINTLKSELLQEKTTNVGLKEEIVSLKEKLQESVSTIDKLSRISENAQMVKDSCEVEFQHTIEGLTSHIDSLKDIIEEKDLALDELRHVKEAFKALQLENKGLKATVSNDADTIEAFEAAKLLDKESLDETYKELHQMVLESSSKDDIIESLRGQIEELRGSSSSEEFESLVSEVQSLREEKQSLLSESKKTYNMCLEEMNQIRAENEELSRKLNESFGGNSYAEDLISVIAGNYGLNSSLVASHLSEGFTKSDIYSVCESLSSNSRKGLSYSNAMIVSESTGTMNKSNYPNTPKIDSFMMDAGNRRGL